MADQKLFLENLFKKFFCKNFNFFNRRLVERIKPDNLPIMAVSKKKYVNKLDIASSLIFFMFSSLNGIFLNLRL